MLSIVLNNDEAEKFSHRIAIENGIIIGQFQEFGPENVPYWYKFRSDVVKIRYFDDESGTVFKHMDGHEETPEGIGMFVFTAETIHNEEAAVRNIRRIIGEYLPADFDYPSHLGRLKGDRADYAEFKEILDEDETFCAYPVSIGNAGASFAAFIIPANTPVEMIDLGGCIEETLHRLLDNGYSDDDICYLTGMEKRDEDDEWVYIDKGYCAPVGNLFPCSLYAGRRAEEVLGA